VTATSLAGAAEPRAIQWSIERDGSRGDPGKVQLTIESRWGETFFSEDVLRGIQQQGPSVFETPLSCPTLRHDRILSQYLRFSLVTKIPAGIFRAVST